MQWLKSLLLLKVYPEELLLLLQLLPLKVVWFAQIAEELQLQREQGAENFKGVEECSCTPLYSSDGSIHVCKPLPKIYMELLQPAWKPPVEHAASTSNSLFEVMPPKVVAGNESVISKSRGFAKTDTVAEVQLLPLLLQPITIKKLALLQLLVPNLLLLWSNH